MASLWPKSMRVCTNYNWHLNLQERNILNNLRISPKLLLLLFIIAFPDNPVADFHVDNSSPLVPSNKRRLN